MARLDPTPYPLPELQAGGSDAGFARQTDELNRLQAESNNLRPDVVVGAMIKFQVADGYAHYRVTASRPLTVQHVPYLDGYSISAAHIRGLTEADIFKQLAGDRGLAAIFKRGDDFYDSLQVGQIVHYHNGFGEYVRCTVVAEGDETQVNDVTSKLMLLPVALVGNWKDHDTVVETYEKNGYISEPFHVKSIREGRTWRANASCIFEASQFKREDVPDPTLLEPLDIRQETVPYTLAEFEQDILEKLPSAVIAEQDGRLLIDTGLRTNDDGNVVPQ